MEVNSGLNMSDLQALCLQTKEKCLDETWRHKHLRITSVIYECLQCNDECLYLQTVLLSQLHLQHLSSVGVTVTASRGR